jgi:hypothetical protein
LFAEIADKLCCKPSCRSPPFLLRISNNSDTRNLKHNRGRG